MRFATVLFPALALLATPALAAPCGPRSSVTATLADKYGESVERRGLQNADAIIEVWTSAESNTFTILGTRSSGVSCVIAAGHYWSRIPLRPKPRGKVQ